MPAALNRAQHHPDSMRPQRHCSSSATRGTSQRCRSNDGIAVEQSQHSVPPTECWDYSAERCRGALERGGVPKRRRHPSSRHEPFVLCTFDRDRNATSLQRYKGLEAHTLAVSTVSRHVQTACPDTVDTHTQGYVSSLSPQIQAHAALGLPFTCPLKNAWHDLWQANSCRRGLQGGPAARA